MFFFRQYLEGVSLPILPKILPSLPNPPLESAPTFEIFGSFTV